MCMSGVSPASCLDFFSRINMGNFKAPLFPAKVLVSVCSIVYMCSTYSATIKHLSVAVYHQPDIFKNCAFFVLAILLFPVFQRKHRLESETKVLGAFIIK